MRRGRPYYRVQWINFDASFRLESFNNVCITIEVMNEFYDKYSIVAGHLIWETFKNDSNNSEFRNDDSDDDSDDNGLFVS